MESRRKWLVPLVSIGLTLGATFLVSPGFRYDIGYGVGYVKGYLSSP